MDKNKTKIAVLGGGSFGTTLANMVAENGFHSVLWVRDAQSAAEIQQHRINARYLPDYKLHENLLITADINEAVTGAEVVLISVPSSSVREVARKAAPLILKDTIVVSTTKGIEKDGFKLMSQILQEEIPQASIAVISGPNIAKEVAERQLTATVVASHSEQTNQVVQKVLQSKYFRVYSNQDVFGVELGGALKNIYAIMAGMGAALGVGQNTLSMLMTRSLAEMGRFAEALGANPATFIGLAGVGDLIVTCLSPHSRNYRVGYALGRGADLDAAIAEIGQVAEGVNTLKLVKHKSDELGIYMPLVNGLYEVLFNKSPLGKVIEGLMTGEQNSDVDFSMHSTAF